MKLSIKEKLYSYLLKDFDKKSNERKNFWRIE